MSRRKDKNRNERGSALVLTIVSVLILSVMVSGLLNVGTTEMYTTRNYQLQKYAYYTAVEGVEEIRNKINHINNNEIDNLKRLPLSNTADPNFGTEFYGYNGFRYVYVTATLEEYEAYKKGVGAINAISRVDTGVIPGTPPASAMATAQGHSNPTAIPVQWQLYVTAEVGKAGLSAYAEILAAVWGAVPESGGAPGLDPATVGISDRRQ